jgi:hypothetical protein
VWFRETGTAGAPPLSTAVPCSAGAYGSVSGADAAAASDLALDVRAVRVTPAQWAEETRAALAGADVALPPGALAHPRLQLWRVLGPGAAATHVALADTMRLTWPRGAPILEVVALVSARDGRTQQKTERAAVTAVAAAQRGDARVFVHDGLARTLRGWGAPWSVGRSGGVAAYAYNWVPPAFWRASFQWARPPW